MPATAWHCVGGTQVEYGVSIRDRFGEPGSRVVLPYPTLEAAQDAAGGRINGHDARELDAVVVVRVLSDWAPAG